MPTISHFSKLTLTIFALIFAGVGSYFIFFSNASTALPSDINNDGVVDISDLSILLSSYGESGTACITTPQYTCHLDPNDSSGVDVVDLSILLSNYGRTASTGNIIPVITPSCTSNCTSVSITWPAQSGATSFQGAYSDAATGGNVTYLGTVTSPLTLTSAPGQTLYYAVASEGPAGELWSDRIAISWTGGGGGGKLKVGVMDIGNFQYGSYYPLSIFKNAGITYTREDVDRGANTGTCNSADYVCVALQGGVVPLVLFEGYADGNMTSEIVSLAQKLDQLQATYPIMSKMHVIEFGNEVYEGTSGPAENASTYGAQYDAAHRALAAAGEGSWKLLSIAANYCSYNSVGWIGQVVAAQSGGAGEVDGWTVHPYGPMNDDTGSCSAHQGFGWPEVDSYHTMSVAAGSNAPFYVTEVGQELGPSTPVPEGSCSDLPGANGYTNGSYQYYTQAADMRQYLTDSAGDTRTGTIAKYPWVAALIWYEVYDDSTGWFGALGGNGVQNNGEPVNYQRPAFCQLQQWISANGEG